MQSCVQFFQSIFHDLFVMFETLYYRPFSRVEVGVLDMLSVTTSDECCMANSKKKRSYGQVLKLTRLKLKFYSQNCSQSLVQGPREDGNLCSNFKK